MGTRAPDGFLFSPRLCGATSTGYVRLGHGDRIYDRQTLADAVTCSAASLTPLLYGNNNPFWAFFLLLFNLNLTAWIENPNPTVRKRRMAFWPFRYLRMVLNGLTDRSLQLAVADGAFADNLGVMELLRRRCSLIVCVDSSMDPQYDFHDLRKLIVRAKSLENVSIELPEDTLDRIRPSAVNGFAKTQVLVAKVRGQPSGATPWEGRLIYVKACLKGPMHGLSNDSVEGEAANYQHEHASFPQETTVDQFFDPPQWHAYNVLGRQLARAVLDHLDPRLGTPSELTTLERRTILLDNVTP